MSFSCILLENVCKYTRIKGYDILLLKKKMAIGYCGDGFQDRKGYVYVASKFIDEGANDLRLFFLKRTLTQASSDNALFRSIST